MSEDIILACYRLAKHYGLDPDVFLNKPLSVIQRHHWWTARLAETQLPQEDDA